MRNEQEANQAIEKYADMVRRICFVHLKNYHDAEDVFQDVFLKYILRDVEFENDAHEKAWFVRVAINACKDTLKSFFKKKVTSIDELKTEPFNDNNENHEILDSILNLKSKYRNVIYLYYYEGYTALEIAAILKTKENTIYTWLSRAKAQLKTSLGGEPFER